MHNCKIQLVSIASETAYEGQGPWLLSGDPFSLAAGDHRFVPFVCYGEAANPKTFSCADSFMQIFPSIVAQPTLDKVGVHTLAIRVTMLDAAPADFSCNVWVDKDGRLRVKKTLTN